jgi:hypothetical protein
MTDLKRSDCPTCGSDNLSDMWRRGRKLRQECRRCDWVGVERTPEQQEIRTTRRVRGGHHGGHTFEVFDRYGHVLMSSMSFGTDGEARAALQRELERGKQDNPSGPYTGILWPATVLVSGVVIR